MSESTYSDFQREKIYKFRKEGKTYKQIAELMGVSVRTPESLATQLRFRKERMEKGVYDPKWYPGCEDFKGRKPKQIIEEIEEIKEPIIRLEPSVPDPSQFSDYYLWKNYDKLYGKKIRGKRG